MKLVNLLDTTVEMLNNAYDSNKEDIVGIIRSASITHVGTLEQFENHIAWDIALKYKIYEKIVEKLKIAEKYSETYVKDMNELLEVAIRKSNIVY